MDKRVRKTHAAKHGYYFDWATSTLNPGEDFRCRCYAEPSFGDNVNFMANKKQFDDRVLQQELETAKGIADYNKYYANLQKEAQASFDYLSSKGKIK